MTRASVPNAALQSPFLHRFVKKLSFGWSALSLLGFFLLCIARAQSLPQLDIETDGPAHVRLSWPSTAAGFALEETGQLQMGQWLPVPQTPELLDQSFSLRLLHQEAERFFRLRGVGSGLPPDPSDVAPEPQPGVVTLLGASAEFLYTGPNPIQTGVSQGTIQAHRAAVVRGKVSQTGGAPLPGVTISILNHPEFGSTLSRVDGMFDLVVNGGGPISVQYEKAGFLPAQRQAGVPSQEFVLLPEVVMLGVDPVVTSVAFGAGVAAQVHQGSVQSDADGTRRAVLLFPPDTSARLVLPNGTVQEVNALSIRATEYTVGTNGPAAMPAVLPPSSAYTYCVEFSADEALATGATIEFDRPVMTYVDNFLGFPIGGIVPAGYYDRKKGVWIPSKNGRVIQVLSTTGGVADVDTNGDGTADTLEGITDLERQRVAGLFTAGQTLWRVPVTHFTPWDYNWPYVPPADATPPNQPPPKTEDLIDEGLVEECGSIIETQNQVLGESLPIAGTGLSLNYRSDRAPGRLAARTVVVPVSGASVPASLKQIEVELQVAGRPFRQTLPAEANQSATFTWDGLDGYGRTLNGRQSYQGTISYVYGAVYSTPAALSTAFGSFGTSPLEANRARQEISIPQPFSGSVGAPDARGMGLAGWALSAHHSYDPAERTLYLGDGRRVQAESVGGILTTVAGNGVRGFGGDGGPATAASFSFVDDIEEGPDGTLYIACLSDFRVRRVGPDGVITTFAGNGVSGLSGTGGPATRARVQPQGLALGQDGSLFISERTSNLNLIRRVGPDGIINSFASKGIIGFSGDGGPAIDARFDGIGGMAIGPDGSLYVGQANLRVRRIGPDGIISTVAGGGSSSPGDGGLATNAVLKTPLDVAVGRDGSLYIADQNDHRVRRVGPDGIITTVAGTGARGFSGDGGPGHLAQLNLPSSVAIDDQGGILIADGANGRIRRVGTDGTITTVAGTGVRGSNFNGDGLPPTLSNIVGGPISWSGGLIVGDFTRVRRVSPALPGFDGFSLAVPSADGRALYRFDASGRHLQTLNALTGAVLLEFGYDTNGRLIQVIEKTGGTDNITTIQHDANGHPTAIISPYGQKTALAVDANGFLARVVNPAGETNLMSYTADGLLTSFTDARGNSSTYQHDPLGLLSKAMDSCCGGEQNYSSTNTGTTRLVIRATGSGKLTEYAVESLATGGRKLVNTWPDGTQDTEEFRPDGTRVAVAPNGAKSTVVLGPDTRFGMAAPVVTSSQLDLPNGSVTRTTSTSTHVLSSPADPLSLVSFSDTTTLNGRTFTQQYTAADRTFTSTTPAGRTQSITVDGFGRPVAVKLPGMHPITAHYDSRGRLSGVSVGDGPGARAMALTYDAQGFPETVTDSLGRTVRYGRDAVGRLTQTQFPDGSGVLLGYDPAGNLTSLTPPGRPAHTFAYDNRNALTTITPPAVPGTGPTTYVSDPEGLLTDIQRPGGEAVRFTYEPSGRPAAIGLTNSDGASAAYTMAYDPAGRLNTVAGPAGQTLRYSYNGPLITGVVWSGPVAGSVSRTFDDSLRPATESVNGQSTVAFTYDADDLLTGVGDLSVTLDAAAGFPVSTALGTVSTAESRDAFGQVTQHTATAGGNNLYEFSHVYDAIGRLTAKTETVAGQSHTFQYAYDSLGQLVSVSRDGTPVEAYAYDANGNRIQSTVNGVTTGATHDAQDRLVTHGSNTYDYTPTGRLRTRSGPGGATAFDYDSNGGLLGVTLPNGTRISYLLDPVGRRIQKQVNGTITERMIYAGDQPVAQLDSNGAIVSRFVYAGGLIPAYLTRGTDSFRILEDSLGSVRLVVHAVTGAIVQRLDYDSYGNVTLDTNPGFQPFGFAGGLYDPDTRLVRFGMRDYDPETGRWSAKDPIGIAGNDANLYRYCYNNPVNLTDPSGLDTWDLFAGFIDEVSVNINLLTNPGLMVASLSESLVNLALSALGIERPPGPAILDAYRPLKNAPFTDNTSADYSLGELVGACTSIAATAGSGAAALGARRAAAAAAAEAAEASALAARNAAARAAAGGRQTLASGAQQAVADARSALSRPPKWGNPAPPPPPTRTGYVKQPRVPGGAAAYNPNRH
jgi:RHS repeat-associated protein